MVYLLHQLLSESAAKYPDKEALAFKDAKMTYAELERESNKLACSLCRNRHRKRRAGRNLYE